MYRLATAHLSYDILLLAAPRAHQDRKYPQILIETIKTVDVLHMTYIYIVFLTSITQDQAETIFFNTATAIKAKKRETL